MKVERTGLGTVERWIKPALPSVITIPVKDNNGKQFVIYLSVPPIDDFATDKELQDVAEEIADKLEAKPKHLHPFFENSL
jgi:hypothetical protein